MTRPKVIPHEYSAEEREEIVDYVCGQIANKRSLFKVLAEDADMPSYATFMKWQRESESISDRVARAREDALEAIIEEIIEIADQGEADVRIEYRDNGKPYAKVDGDVVQRAKLRVYAREKAAQMLAPRRFGTQRMDVTSGGKPIDASTNVTLIENRVASVIMLAQQRAEERKALEAMIDV